MNWERLTVAQRAYRLAYSLALQDVSLIEVARIEGYQRWKYVTMQGHVFVTDENLLQESEDFLADYIAARFASEARRAG